MADSQGFVTSFAGLFTPRAQESQPGNNLGADRSGEQRPSTTVSRIEIPLIQRDYAQGRDDHESTIIRTNFVRDLRKVLESESDQLSLDFIYGHIENGMFVPLDGQQRLTTLLLLHWYLAVTNGVTVADQPWSNFTYQTRSSSADFCRQITKTAPPPRSAKVSDWIRDQHWFQYSWKYDPTIQGMLTMLTAIETEFATRTETCWCRLQDQQRPPIWFHVHFVRGLNSATELYIKMNSRGRALTTFEVFKANLLKLVRDIDADNELARLVDTEWLDVMWPYRTRPTSRVHDELVDDQMLRYMQFLMSSLLFEIDEDATELSPLQMATQLFGSGNPRRAANLERFKQGFNVWVGCDATEWFQQIFVSAKPQEFLVDDLNGRVRLFSGDSDLLGKCASDWGEHSGKRPMFTLSDHLMLVAAIEWRAANGPEITSVLLNRMRILRNLLGHMTSLSSGDMGVLIQSTKHLILNGLSDDHGLPGFSKRAVSEELQKQRLIEGHPELAGLIQDLESHSFLRGSIDVFDLDSEKLEGRARAFLEGFADEGATARMVPALLAVGDYSRFYTKNRKTFRLGAVAMPGMLESFQELFSSPLGSKDSREHRDRMRRILMQTLDRVCTGRSGAEGVSVLVEDFLRQREADECFDWRYYMVKYAPMRDAPLGLYYSEDPSRYEMPKLLKTQINAFFRDPYIDTIAELAGIEESSDELRFAFWEGLDPVLRVPLKDPVVTLRCRPYGFEVKPLVSREDNPELYEVLEKTDYADGSLRVPQRIIDGIDVDTQDRIVTASALVMDCLKF